ncbi:hypothetical protein M885DRAFT_536229 [Pelagophyceae sp. CCMP2097]|nr:hypothetical protein M885DRAFT_536229 [Pelagophyceae sp. CCMP2097]|mmetsp:Transcript_24223/g.81691  ORF Transcript_24223/g.81691 Transcript_24223/m.81691 type:complete len:354 (-) Transcript_24223:220-1281(-)
MADTAAAAAAQFGGMDAQISDSFRAAMSAQSLGQRVPPLFSAAPGTSQHVTINLDDIFADCFFTQEGEPGPAGAAAGARAATPRPALRPKAEKFDDDDEDDDESDDDDDGGDGGRGKASKKPKRGRAATREMTESQKNERRERNREHAKRSRVRKKFLLESLQQSVNALQFENDKLRGAIRDKTGDKAPELLSRCSQSSQKKTSLIARTPQDATRVLDDPDYSLVKALQTAQQNFVITDPSLPDNPIVFASHGFLTLTGYSLENVLGRNCRFLQGPQTDPRAVAKIRKAVDEGYDTSVCLLNYRIDGSTFYNQFFVAPLRDGDGNVVNYVGVQCQVSDAFAHAIAKEEPFAIM